MNIPVQAFGVKRQRFQSTLRQAGVIPSSLTSAQIASMAQIPAQKVFYKRRPTVAYATTDVRCGNTTYTISTGTKGGSCYTNASGGKTTDGNCANGDNGAEVNCSWNSGQGKCGAVTGSGSCSIKATM